MVDSYRTINFGIDSVGFWENSFYGQTIGRPLHGIISADTVKRS